jgi:hypothetical protein
MGKAYARCRPRNQTSAAAAAAASSSAASALLPRATAAARQLSVPQSAPPARVRAQHVHCSDCTRSLLALHSFPGGPSGQSASKLRKPACCRRSRSRVAQEAIGWCASQRSLPCTPAASAPCPAPAAPTTRNSAAAGRAAESARTRTEDSETRMSVGPPRPPAPACSRRVRSNTPAVLRRLCAAAVLCTSRDWISAAAESTPAAACDGCSVQGYYGRRQAPGAPIRGRAVLPMQAAQISAAAARHCAHSSSESPADEGCSR